MITESNWMKLVSLIAGIALMVGISIEVLTGDHRTYSEWYLWLQFIVCVVFIIDFLGEISSRRKSKRHYFINVLFLLISIPYLNILHWSGVAMGHDLAGAVMALTLIRAFVAMVVVVKWMIESRVSRIFGAYIFTVVCFTYLAALMFYDYEVLVNDKLHGFGNALWWAWMNVTTVGAEIFPVTAIGKVFCIMLPSLGMMFFPIFTTYVLQEYTHKKRGRSVDRSLFLVLPRGGRSACRGLFFCPLPEKVADFAQEQLLFGRCGFGSRNGVSFLYQFVHQLDHQEDAQGQDREVDALLDEGAVVPVDRVGRRFGNDSAAASDHLANALHGSGGYVADFRDVDAQVREVGVAEQGADRGIRMSLTSDDTILPNAPPMMTPTAMSITLPLRANSLNSLKNAMIRTLF